MRSTPKRAYELLTLLVLAALSFWAYPTDARPIHEKVGRLEVDWSELKLRFYGEASIAEGETTYKAAERRSWSEGFRVGQNEIADFYRAHFGGSGMPQAKVEQGAKLAAQELRKRTVSRRTDYFPDGKVRVNLEAPLAPLMKMPAVNLLGLEKAPVGESSFSSIVIRLDNYMDPKASFRIEDERGRLLYDESKVLGTAYSKRLLGRWLQKAGPQEMSRFGGSKPISVRGVVVDQTRVRVSSKTWAEITKASARLVAEAQLILVNP